MASRFAYSRCSSRSVAFRYRRHCHWRCGKMQLLQDRSCINSIQYRTQATNANLPTLQQYQLREELERDQSKCQSSFASGKFALFHANKPYMTKTDRGTLIMAKIDYQGRNIHLFYYA